LQFKIVLARELVEPNPCIAADIESGNDLAAIKSKVFFASSQALRDTIEGLDDLQLERAVHALSEAKRVVVYGVGEDNPVAIDAYQKFLEAGKVAIALSDGVLIAISSLVLSKDDVVLGISHSGDSRDINDAFDRAKASGATTICITASPISPITQVSDICLFAAARQPTFGSSTRSSRIAQLAIVDTISLTIALRNRGTRARSLAERSL
jgi:RpiR family transcriptional regulator, carbohydrate utilization regulator